MLKDSKIPNIYTTIEKTSKDNRYYDTQIKKLHDMESKQQEWIESDIIEKINTDFYILKKDIFFSSPSNAACYAKGHYAVNGWTEWKNDKKKSLDDVYRK